MRNLLITLITLASINSVYASSNTAPASSQLGMSHSFKECSDSLSNNRNQEQLETAKQEAKQELEKLEEAADNKSSQRNV